MEEAVSSTHQLQKHVHNLCLSCQENATDAATYIAEISTTPLVMLDAINVK